MQHQVVSRDEWLAARLGLAAISGYPTARPAQRGAIRPLGRWR
jgi:hypothetical protein